MRETARPSSLLHLRPELLRQVEPGVRPRHGIGQGRQQQRGPGEERDRRDVLKDILENSVPITPQDVVLIFCTVTGWRKGLLVQKSDARKIYHGEFLGERCSAIQITTAASLCAVLDLHFTGKLPTQGFVKQEQVNLPDFLANRFGRCYDVSMKDLSLENGVAV